MLGSDNLLSDTIFTMRVCEFPDCRNKHFGRGLCVGHYAQRRAGKELTKLREVDPYRPCSFDECDRIAKTRELCASHYAQLARGTPLRPFRKPYEDCEVFFCSKKATRKRLCVGHYEQSRRGTPFTPLRAPHKEGRTLKTAQGYVMEKYSDHPNRNTNGWVFQHVKVVSDSLGRALLPGENVHHINGVRDDNRLENLELWVRPQPTGIRAEDAVEWAVHILELYYPEKLISEMGER